MAITKKPARQEIIAARVVASLGSSGDISAQATYEAIEVPAGAIVIGGYINITDATTASVVIDVGDGGVGNRYKNDVAADSTGLTALVPTGYKYTTADTIDLTIAGATPAATGEVELVVQYIVDGRAAFTQG
jgi:hypothetical protein